MNTRSNEKLVHQNGLHPGLIIYTDFDRHSRHHFGRISDPYSLYCYAFNERKMRAYALTFRMRRFLDVIKLRISKRAGSSNLMSGRLLFFVFAFHFAVPGTRL